MLIFKQPRMEDRTCVVGEPHTFAPDSDRSGNTMIGPVCRTHHGLVSLATAHVVDGMRENCVSMGHAGAQGRIRGRVRNRVRALVAERGYC